MKKKIFIALGGFVLIAVMILNAFYQNKKSNPLFDMYTIFNSASADCEWDTGWTTTCDYVVQYYCRFDGPYGSLVVLDCRPN